MPRFSATTGHLIVEHERNWQIFHPFMRHEPDRTLYLAVPEEVCKSVFEEEARQILIQDGLIRLFSFNPTQEEIIPWIP
ncbi:hypothetical protein H6F90_03815 [Trichocoleus sp. FACHB-591]|uniref:element excision factor XisH family protein n=1 Tax=Trichocoleus sp. FACHB-591 TaxID=2692872 RepID=UPI001687AFF9|nr:element excision factor XisH family protein [Trichocoleus sp. FACHB-591]MBD2094274.1 hypothetical protein [Trichocoleus sp. FACHB-591]